MFSEEFTKLKNGLNLNDLGLTQDDLVVPKINTNEEIKEDVNSAPSQDINKQNPLSDLLNTKPSNPITKPVGRPINEVPRNQIDLPPPPPKAEIKKDSESDVSANNIQRFTKQEKENVIASFVSSRVFTKRYMLNNMFNLVLKTISDEKQQELNNELQRIDISGDRRKHAYFYGPGSGEEFDTVYHVDQLRAKRIKIISYHLHSILDTVLSDESPNSVSMAEKYLLSLPTNLLNVIFTKCMNPFLALVEEACSEIEIF